MEIDCTRHAREKIAERKMSEKTIEKALKNPDNTIKGKFGRKIIHKLIGDKLLRIIYTKTKKKYTIITVYYAKPERYEVKK